VERYSELLRSLDLRVAKQLLHRLQLIELDSIHEGSLAVPVLVVHVSALFEQLPDELYVAVDASVHEVGLAFFVHDGVVGSEFGRREEAFT